MQIRSKSSALLGVAPNPNNSNKSVAGGGGERRTYKELRDANQTPADSGEGGL